MEDFSPSLAREFMEHLKAECSSLAAIGDLAVKLKTLQIVFDITSATKYFESLFNKLQLHPLYNIDKDMDYGEWAKLDGWVKKVERIWWNSSEAHGYKPDGTEKKEAIDTLYMSTLSYARDKKESKALIDEEKSKIHSAIDVLLSDVYLGGEKIDVAIYNSLSKLAVSLNKIDIVLKEEAWSQEQYSNMVNDILKKDVGLKSFDPAFKKYNYWRKMHSKIIDVPMLKRKLAVELKELFDSKFIIYDITEIDKEKADKLFVQAEYNLLDQEKNDEIKKEYTRIYYKLRLLINYSAGRYDFNDLGDLGMYIFQNRHSLKDESIDAMVKFIKTTTLIYEDIDKIEGDENQNSETIEELKCSLSEDKINQCYFKSYKEVWLAIIEEHIDELKGNKALWVSVYYVLIKYKMIDDNSKKFCEIIKNIFDVRIDNSNLLKDWRNCKGKEYKDWIVNQRSSRKRDLAKEIDMRFKKYYESKTGEIMKTLK